MESARGRLVAFHDVDDEYSPSDLVKLVAALDAHRAVAATGTRRRAPGWQRMTRANQLGNQFLTACFNWANRANFTDVCCGTKVFTKSALEVNHIREGGWAIDVETLALLTRSGNVVEVPVEYTPRTAKDGKKIRWYHGVRIVQAIWRLRRSR